MTSTSPASLTTDSTEAATSCAAGELVLVTYEGSNVDGGRFRNTEILTVRGQQIVEAEVYFGWSVPHEAPVGALTDK